ASPASSSWAPATATTRRWLASSSCSPTHRGVTLFDPEPPPVPTPTVRVRMTVAYDGRGYHGFAAQTGVKTVGGTLTTSLERVLHHPVALTCAGRTDAGVHAWGQVVKIGRASCRERV